MGDRRNVIIKDAGTVGVALYTHWAGSDLAETVKTALKRKQRWDDAPYLARIIFCEMVKGDETKETGYGITAADATCEGSKRDIVIDVEKQTITLMAEAAPISLEHFIA